MSHLPVCVSAVLSLTLLCSNVRSEIYYVLPFHDNSTCPEEDVPCFTLSEFANKENDYFSFNTTLIFLPGDHILDSTGFRIMNIRYLVMTTTSWASISCNITGNFQFGNFRFENIDQVSVSNLAFFGCVQNIVTFIDQFTLENCTLDGQEYYEPGIGHFGQATGLDIRHVNNVDIIESSFVSFKRGAIFINCCELYYIVLNPHSDDNPCPPKPLIASNVFITNSLFEGNEADGPGGAVCINNVNIIIDNCLFVDNIVNVTVPNDVFLRQTDVPLYNGRGGALYADNSNITVDDTAFVNNTVTGYRQNFGAFYFAGSVVALCNCNFSGNTITSGQGAAFAALSSTLFTTGSLDIRNNNGTAVYAIESTIRFSGSVTFSQNSGGLEIYSSNVAILHMVKIINNSSPLSAYQSSNVEFDGDIYFMYNSGSDSGGVILLFNSRLCTDGTTTISNNVVSSSGGGIYAYQSELNFRGRTIISGNKADQNGGGISAVSTTINFCEGVLQFIGNSAKRGGGMYLESNTKLFIRKAGVEYIYSTPENRWLTLEFTENFAEYGGAMYINDGTFSTCGYDFHLENAQLIDTECFLQTTFQQIEFIRENLFPNYINIRNTYFANNTADIAGDILYGGLLDRCTLNQFSEIRALGIANDNDTFLKIFPDVTNINKNFTSSAVISSEPVRVYFCTNAGQPDETYDPPKIHVRKGQLFKIPVVAVDQAGNPVKATIRSSTESGQLDRGQADQRTNLTCTNLEYRVFSPNSTEKIHIYADGPCNSNGISRSSIDIQFEPCPIGFEETENGCICDSCLSSNKMFISDCSIDTDSVLRKDNVWIGLDDTSSQFEYIIHPNCPFDYCRHATEEIFINLNSSSDFNGSNVQCAFNRAGKLCGSCKYGLSLILGSSRCKLCSNSWIAVFIIFVLMGIALVIYTLALNLTVAVGTINGLIFYANIIAVDRSVFLPFDSPNFFTIFIAWLNLDVGIETCFYDGLDGYARTWLQFVFPAYLLFLVAMVILIASLSQRFAKLLSNRNPVAALATLILISYTKLLRTVIAALQFARLEYRTADSKCARRIVTVWLLDGNVDYFEGKHIPLFIMAIAVVFVGLIFTFLLIFWQWLQHCPNKCYLRWLRNDKLNAFMDAYLAPYKRKYRFWPGLLLLVRVLLYLTASVTDGNKSVTLLVIICLNGGLVFLNGFVKDKVYKNWLINALEILFIFNVVVFATATLYIQSAAGNQEALAYTSTSIAFITYLAIASYHLFDSFKPLRNIANKIKEEQINKRVEEFKSKLADLVNKLTETEQANELQEVNIKEEEEFCELREPVLDDPMINIYHGDEQPISCKPVSPTHTEVDGIPQKHGIVTHTIV